MRLALLMNFVAPYRVPLFEHLHRLVGDFRVLASTHMERDRHWVPEWGSLNVVVQRNITLGGRVRDQSGFSRKLQIHVPYDTIPQLLRYRPDAVITAELGFRSLQAALFKLLRPGTPLVVWCLLSEHTERNWGEGRRAMRRFILSQADRVIVNGESGARYIHRFGVPDGRIVRVNQPIDVARFAAASTRGPVPSSDAAVNLLHVGQLNGRKGVVQFASSLIAWAERNPIRRINVDWVGDGEDRSTLEGLPWPGSMRCRFHGNLPYDQIPATYAKADILVFPTLCDEWGLVVNEAMACGVPVLGSIYSQAVEELVEDGRNGWVFDPLDVTDVSAVLDRALNTGADERAIMGTAAAHRVADLTPEAAALRIARAVASCGVNVPAVAHSQSIVDRPDLAHTHQIRAGL